MNGNDQLSEIAVDELQPHPSNPRKTIDPSALKELAASIKASGVLQPLTVTKGTEPGKHLIVIGERRWRAAKLAKLATVPCRIRVFETAELVREAQLIENLQRADIHPLEEADGYWNLATKDGIDGAGVTTETAGPKIAKAVSKTVEYVTKRLRLLSLIAEAREAFLERDIALDHALLLCAIEPADQLRALRYVFDPQGMRKSEPIDEMRKDCRDPRKHEEYVAREAASARELRHWIETNVALDLSKVEWELDDKRLLPEAGACTDCTKRTGHNVALFGDLVDVKDSTCMDGACFRAKRQAFVQLQAQVLTEEGKTVVRLSNKASTARPPADRRKDPATQADGRTFKVGQFSPAARGSCEHVVTGVYVDTPPHRVGGVGEDQGKPGTKRSVCVDPDCKKHRKAYQRTATQRQQPDYQVEQQKRKDRDEAERPARKKAVLAIVDAAGDRGWDEKFQRFIVRMVLDDKYVHDDGRDLLKELFGWQIRGGRNDAELVRQLDNLKLSTKTFAKALAAIVLSEYLVPNLYDAHRNAAERKDLLQAAQYFGAGNAVKKVLDRHDRELAEAKKLKAGTCRYCKCTETAACNPPCAWADKAQTVCSAAPCLKKATAAGIKLLEAAKELAAAAKAG